MTLGTMRSADVPATPAILKSCSMVGDDSAGRAWHPRETGVDRRDEDSGNSQGGRSLVAAQAQSQEALAGLQATLGTQERAAMDAAKQLHAKLAMSQEALVTTQVSPSPPPPPHPPRCVCSLHAVTWPNVDAMQNSADAAAAAHHAALDTMAADHSQVLIPPDDLLTHHHNTTFLSKRAGGAVNLEFDILGKYALNKKYFL